jgi:hypothetical protein
MPDVPRVQLFSSHILDRQLALYREYRQNFPNIYKERVAEYFIEVDAYMPDRNGNNTITH